MRALLSLTRDIAIGTGAARSADAAAGRFIAPILPERCGQVKAYRATNGPMADWSIEHISAVTLAVRDMAESVAFYRRLGLEVTYGGPEAPFTTLRADQAVINLRRAVVHGDNSWSRVILRVRGVDALHRELSRRGVAAAVPRDAEWGERYFEVQDPQGVVISFAELLP
jgi:catechol 2,3-dioxygenase-like lactoylglutathione lyase family enzyme